MRKNKNEHKRKDRNMADMFDGPGSSQGIQWSDLEHRLLLITPKEKDVAVSTAFGESTAVRADVIMLDGPDAPGEINDTLIFPKMLQSQVKSNVGTGRMNLGRLGKGTAKPGQSPPWMLDDPTDADKETARAYISRNQKPPF